MITTLFLALALSTAPTGTTTGAAGERLSLEELLAHYRAERDALLSQLRDRVAMVLQDLDAAAEAGKSAEVSGAFERLMELGAPSAPLLVAALDPGPAASEGQVARARVVVRVLREFRSPAILSELLAMLKTGAAEGRRNALRVLGTTSEGERVSAEVRAFYAKAKGEERLPALEALAEIGGPENEDFLGGILSSKDTEVAAFALRSLAQVGNSAVAGEVLALVRSTAAAAPLVSELIAYYRASPSAVNSEVCQALLELVESRRPDSKQAVRILELLPDFEREWPSSMKKELRQIAESSDRDVLEAALVALTRTGDRGAKRELLEPYDRRIEEQRNWAKVFEERAGILYRIEDYKEAIQDYREALRVGREVASSRGDIHVQIARCHARMGKLKEAHDSIDGAPITMAQRRALATDPVFAELVENPRYREVFRLE